MGGLLTDEIFFNRSWRFLHNPLSELDRYVWRIIKWVQSWDKATSVDNCKFDICTYIKQNDALRFSCPFFIQCLFEIMNVIIKRIVTSDI